MTTTNFCLVAIFMLIFPLPFSFPLFLIWYVFKYGIYTYD